MESTKLSQELSQNRTKMWKQEVVLTCSGMYISVKNYFISDKSVTWHISCSYFTFCQGTKNFCEINLNIINMNVNDKLILIIMCLKFVIKTKNN